MERKTNYSGFWMLAGLVIMLVIPMAVGHFALPPAPEVTLHADAASANN